MNTECLLYKWAATLSPALIATADEAVTSFDCDADDSSRAADLHAKSRKREASLFPFCERVQACMSVGEDESRRK